MFQESQHEEQLPDSSEDVSSDGNTCLESVIETQERLSQVSCSEHPFQAVPRAVTIPGLRIDGEEECYDCELCQGSCSGETPEQGEREMVTQECEISPDTQESDQELTTSKLPHGGKLSSSLNHPLSVHLVVVHLKLLFTRGACAKLPIIVL